MTQLTEQPKIHKDTEIFKQEWLIKAKKRNGYQPIYSIEHQSCPAYRLNWYLGPLVMNPFWNIFPNVCSIYQDSIAEITLILYNFESKEQQLDENLDFNQLIRPATQAIRDWYLEKKPQRHINPHFLEVFS